jgi:2'-5' RNA ligase
VEAATVRAGFPPEDRVFSAHVTLSRLQPPGDVTGVAEQIGDLGLEFDVNEVVLYESRLLRGPAVYERLAEFPLERGGVAGPPAAARLLGTRNEEVESDP